MEYSSTYSANVNSGKVPVLDADEFRAYIDEYYPENTLSGAAVHKAINYTYPDGTIGYYNTDWQKGNLPDRSVYRPEYRNIRRR
ncbi:MAG: hypothetical protein ACLVL2_26290 [Bacteroides cellulosilyticus]